MLDDTEAITRSVGQPAVFELIFDRHFGAVHRYIGHCLGPDAADDLAAETFVRAFAARMNYAPLTADARRGCSPSPRTSCATRSDGAAATAA